MTTQTLAGEVVAVVGSLLRLNRHDLAEMIQTAGGRLAEVSETAPTVVATRDPNDAKALAKYRKSAIPVLRESLFERWFIGKLTRAQVMAEARAEALAPLSGARVAFAFEHRTSVDLDDLHARAWRLGATPLRRLTAVGVRRGGRFIMVRDPGSVVENASTRLAQAHGLETMSVDAFLRLSREWARLPRPASPQTTAAISAHFEALLHQLPALSTFAPAF